MMKFGKEQDIG